MTAGVGLWCGPCRKIALFGGALLVAFAFLSWRPPSVALARQEGENQEDQRKQLIAECNRLVDQAGALADKGEHREAIEVARRLLAIQGRLYGEEHNDLAVSLEWIADQEERLEDFGAAIETRTRALAMRKKLHGEKDWRVTDARLAVAGTQQLAQLSADDRSMLRRAEQLVARVSDLHGRSQFRAAIDAASEALDIRKKILGEEHREYARSLNDLAVLYGGIGDYARAEPLHQQALAIRKKVLGEEHPDYAGSLNNLAILYSDMADYARAEPLYRQALAIRKKILGDEHPVYAASLNNLALLYSDMGDYARSRPLHQQALAIRKQVLGEEHPDYAVSLNDLAVLYYRMGDYARAEPLYRQALKLTRKVLGEEHPVYATNLSNLAILYEGMGDHARSEPLFQEALKLTKKVLGEEHPAYAMKLNNLAAMYAGMADYARAEPLYQQALETRKKVLGEEHPLYAESLNNLALLYEDTGDYARSRPLFEQAMTIKRKTLGEAHPDYASTLNNLAGLYLRMGDNARAEPLYRQTVTITKNVLGEEHPHYASSLKNLAAVYWRMGDYQRAEQLLGRSLTSTRKLLELTAAVQSERQQLAMMAQMRHVLDVYLSIAPQADVPPEAAYAHVLSWKGRVFLRQQQARLARREPELADLFDELDETTSRLATLALATPTPKQREARDRQLRELSAQKERLEAELSGRSAAFRQSLQPAGLADLESALPKGAALVDFLEYTHFAPPENGKGDFQTERRLAAFMVRAQAPLVRVELGATEPLAQAIDTWRKSYGRSQEASKAAREIRRRVWAPLEAHLADAEIVLLSPDGALGRFPLAALPGSQEDRFLLEERQLAVVPVPQALPGLLHGERPKQVAGNLLVLGGVDYDADPGKSSQETAPPKKAFGRLANRGVARAGGREKFAFLEATAGELARIKDLYGEYFGPQGLTALEGSAASEAAVRREAQRHQYLHLATHGYFAPPELRSALAGNADETSQDEPAGGQQFAVSGFHPGLLSGLALAGANFPPSEAEGYDGILAAEEVAALDLSGVDVAVLSACQTGLGQSAGGEGLLGLQRAFQMAGARTVVATLWKVDDHATRDLMERFYANLWERDMGTLAALREAQLWMLNKRGPRGLKIENEADQPRHLPPYYWAAFVLSGDWR